MLPVIRLIIVSFMLVSGAVTAQADKLIQIIIDNSGTLQNHEQADFAIRGFLGLKATEFRRSEFRDATVHIVTTHDPRTIYEGPARGLSRAITPLILPEVKFQQEGCNQLDEAINRMSRNVASRSATEVEIYVFSSLIHTGAPCVDVDLDLPQAVPSTIDITSLMPQQTTVLHFLWAHRLQEQTWANAIQRSPIFQTMREQGIDYIIRGEAVTTQFVLENL